MNNAAIESLVLEFTNIPAKIAGSKNGAKLLVHGNRSTQILSYASRDQLIAIMPMIRDDLTEPPNEPK